MVCYYDAADSFGAAIGVAGVFLNCSVGLSGLVCKR